MKENFSTVLATETAPKANGVHLHSTSCVIETSGNIQQKSKKQDIKSYLLQDQGKKVLYISTVDRILKVFKEITFSAKDLSGRLYMIDKDSHGTKLDSIINMAKETAIYQEYEIGDALLLLKRLIKSEAFQNEECKRVIVFIKRKPAENQHRFTYIDLIEGDPESNFPGYYLRDSQDSNPGASTLSGRFGFLFRM